MTWISNSNFACLNQVCKCCLTVEGCVPMVTQFVHYNSPVEGCVAMVTQLVYDWLDAEHEELVPEM